MLRRGPFSVRRFAHTIVGQDFLDDFGRFRHLVPMIAVPFDTLKMARKLEASGFPAVQAAGAAEAMAEAMATSDVATKADLNATQSDLERSISQVRTDLEHKIDKVDLKIELLRRDMTIRLGAMLIGSTSIILAALRLMPHP